MEPERVSKRGVLLVAVADTVENLQPAIRRCFSHEISMGSLSEAQRFKILFQTLKCVTTANDEVLKVILIHAILSNFLYSSLIAKFYLQEFLKYIAGQTSGFMPRDISALVADASASFIHRILNDVGVDKKYNVGNTKGFPVSKDEGGSGSYSPERLSREDFSKALERSKKRNASALGTPKVSRHYKACFLLFCLTSMNMISHLLLANEWGHQFFAGPFV